MVENLIKYNSDIANTKRLEKNYKSLLDKPLVINHIMNEINEKNNTLYIKDRDKLIVKMLISGLNSSEIVELRRDNIEELSINIEYKREVSEFANKYYEDENQSFLFLDKKKQHKITTTTVNNIKKKYLKNKI